MVRTDSEILDGVQYDRFMEVKNNDERYDAIDFDYISTSTMSDSGRHTVSLFNELLLDAKYEHDIDIFPVLIELTKRYIDASKLKFYINDSVKWVIAEEVREDYSFIEAEVFESTLGDFI